MRYHQPKINRRPSKCVYRSRVHVKMSERASEFGTLLPRIHIISSHLKCGDLLFETAKSLLNTQRPVSFLPSGIHSTTIPRHPLCAGHCLLATARIELTPGERRRQQQQVSCQVPPHHPESSWYSQCLPAPNCPQTGISMHQVRPGQTKQGPSSYQTSDKAGNT